MMEKQFLSEPIPENRTAAGGQDPTFAVSRSEKVRT